MFTERILSQAVRIMNGHYLDLKPLDDSCPRLPGPKPGKRYMLYLHIPFCERLCPYCSFNRFPFEESKARRYFANLRREMEMVADLGYDFDSLYVGGGTPTILIDELVETIEKARGMFSIEDVSSETNPNHLAPEYIEKLDGVVQRLSVGVQSFDDSLLKQMDRYDKYGSAQEILTRVREVADAHVFKSLNVDMIFNFPAQTEEMLINDIAAVLESHTNQTTFYPLMASPAVERALAATVGEVDYAREQQYYETICEGLAGGDNPAFCFGDAWTFNDSKSAMIDEYIIDYEEYPALGSGGMSFLDSRLFVNTFSVNEYDRYINSGRMSVAKVTEFSKRDHMRYRFMMQLFGLRLDKKIWERDFGCTVAAGLPAEYAFFKTSGALDIDDAEQITLTSKGRYMMVAMMRQFFIGVNGVRDDARSGLPADERELLFGAGVPIS
jgi:coproporphyrinogen III oxidase-like Fe-S oxidoreductase